MRLLGSNLLPFSVAQLPGTWSTGIEVEAYFFEGNMPADMSAYFQDHRKLIADAVAISRIVLQPTTEGLVLQQGYSYGVKAVAGSVYDPKLGVTIHYPKSIIPRRTTASASAFDIDTAYASTLSTGNSKMKQHLSVGLFPGFPVGTVRQLSDFVGNTVAQMANVADVDFGRAVTIDAALSDDPYRSNVASLQISAVGSSGTSASGTSVTLSVPVNVSTNTAPAPLNTDVIRCVGNANSLRRVLPVSVGDQSTAKQTKSIGYAILLIPDSNFGSLAVGNYDIRFMATKVGLKDSGELIEVESLNVSTGEYVELVQMRTSTELGASNGLPAWVDPDAKFAVAASYLNASPSKDAFGTPFTYSGFSQQSDNAMLAAFGSTMTVAPADNKIDPTKSFTISFDFKQNVANVDCEMCLMQMQTSFTDRIIIALDRSNETGLVLWNNQQSSKIARPWNLYSALRTTEFVKVKYTYDATSATHTIYVNGNAIDSFVYKILPISKAPLIIKGAYGNSSSATVTLRNFQIIQATGAILESGTYQILNKQSGNITSAYIDASVDGGPWLLIGSWRSLNAAPEAQRKYSETIQKGKTVKPYVEIVESGYPVFTESFINHSDQWMFTDDNPGWTALYGNYMFGATLAENKIAIGATEALPVSTPLGLKNVYGRGAGWGADSTLDVYNFGLWTTAGSGGPCGGNNVIGSNKICPTFGDWGGSSYHCDGTGNKKLWLRVSKEDFTILGKSEQTYQQFLDASAALPAQDLANGYFTKTNDTKAVSFDLTTPSTRTMWGSPYGTYLTYDSNPAYMVLHCCPDLDVYNDILTNKRRVVFVQKYAGNLPSYNSVSRNTYTSATYGTFDGLSITKFVYWDYKLNKMMQVNPLLASTPVSWDGTF